MKKILFLFIILFSIFSLFRHNNYSVIQNTTIYFEIANPIFNINFDSPVILDNSNLSIKYSFKINNFNNENISDIPFYYYFYIENIPNPEEFEFHYFLDNTEIYLNNFKSDSFYFTNFKKEEYTFTINIKYISNFNSSISSNPKIKLFYGYSNHFDFKEFDFLKINIIKNNINFSTPSNSSPKRNKKETAANKSTPQINSKIYTDINQINSDIFIDTNTNIQINISK